MKRIPEVKLGLDGLSDSAILERGRNHVTMLTGNAAFPTPTPKLSDITTACDELEASIQDVLFNGGKVSYELKRTRSRALRALIKELAGYVQALCQGDANLILSAGFEVVSNPKPVDGLDMPQNLRALLTDQQGQVPLRWNTVANATNYQVFANSVDPNDESKWELVAFTSRTRYTVEALQSAKFYWFRVQALGRKGLLSPMSDDVKALAA